jgi:hypothetical protein
MAVYSALNGFTGQTMRDRTWCKVEVAYVPDPYVFTPGARGPTIRASTICLDEYIVKRRIRMVFAHYPDD